MKKFDQFFSNAICFSRRGAEARRECWLNLSASAPLCENVPGTNWRTVRRTLRDLPQAAAMREAGEFWQEFHARRVLHPQRPALAQSWHVSPLRLPALAAAALVMLLLSSWLRSMRTPVLRPAADVYAAISGTDEAAQMSISGGNDLDLDDEEGDS